MSGKNLEKISFYRPTKLLRWYVKIVWINSLVNDKRGGEFSKNHPVKKQGFRRSTYYINYHKLIGSKNK